MGINLKDSFAAKAPNLEGEIWKAVITDQRVLLALQSGNIGAGHILGSKEQQEKAEKEKKENADNFAQQLYEASMKSFMQSVANTKAFIGETRRQIQEQIKNLDKVEEDFQNDVILIDHGLEIYPDANNPTQYFYQDECGCWHKLEALGRPEYLEEAQEIHRNKGKVKTMQQKMALDQYKDDLRAEPAKLKQAEATVNDIQQQVENGTLGPEDGREKVEAIEDDIQTRQETRDQLFGTTQEEGVAFVPKDYGPDNDLSNENLDIQSDFGFDNDPQPLTPNLQGPT